MEMGPVPMEFYSAIWNGITPKSDKFRFVRVSDSKVMVENTSEPSLDYFSDMEIDEMESILERFAVGNGDIEALISETHKKIRAWGVAWKAAQQIGSRRMPMKYADEFDGINAKSADELNPEEERFLCYMDIASRENTSFDF
jgi:hypothetical protein